MKNLMTVETAGDRAVVISRTFDAPRQLVWDAMSEPGLLRRWLFGPPGWAMTVCEDDPRVGGAFRWVWAGPDGAGLTMTGTYREVVPPERAVRVERFEAPGCGPGMGEQLATLVLAERGNQTAMTVTVEYPSGEARAAALASGMERGMAAGYDRLDVLLAAA